MRVRMTAETLQKIDKYIVLENLGKGAKSTIWKIEDPADGRVYTLKRVIKETEEDSRFFEQVRIEHSVCSRVNSEYLRKSFEIRSIRRWLKTQELLLLLEYVEGTTLKEAPPTEIEDVIDIFIKVGQGLESLHQFGFVHADIKPKNILLTKNSSRIKIIDFGQTCPIGHRKERIQGTPDYMAPEQVDRGILDQRTDVFNLGASMYWVLTGKNYPTTMPRQAEEMTVTGMLPRQVARPDEVNRAVPMALSKLVMDCCNYNLHDRPENMRDVIARLDVAKHLMLRQKHPEQFAKKKTNEDTDTHKPVSSDDTDEFDQFLEGIL